MNKLVHYFSYITKEICLKICTLYMYNVHRFIGGVRAGGLDLGHRFEIHLFIMLIRLFM